MPTVTNRSCTRAISVGTAIFHSNRNEMYSVMASRKMISAFTAFLLISLPHVAPTKLKLTSSALAPVSFASASLTSFSLAVWSAVADGTTVVAVVGAVVVAAVVAVVAPAAAVVVVAAVVGVVVVAAVVGVVVVTPAPVSVALVSPRRLASTRMRVPPSPLTVWT